MANISSFETFKLGKAMQQALKGEDAPNPKQGELRFYFDQKFTDYKAMQSWCQRLGTAIDTQVDFIGAGNPVPRIVGAAFQITVKTEAPLANMLRDNNFVDFIHKSRNYNKQNAISVGDNTTVFDISDDFTDDWALQSVSAKKEKPAPLTFEERSAILRQNEINTKTMLAGLTGENQKSLQQSYNMIHQIISTANTLSRHNDHIALTPVQARTISALATSIKTQMGAKFILMENSFLKLSLVLEGWNPMHQDIMHAGPLIKENPSADLEDHSPH